MFRCERGTLVRPLGSRCSRCTPHKRRARCCKRGRSFRSLCSSRTRRMRHRWCKSCCSGMSRSRTLRGSGCPTSKLGSRSDNHRSMRSRRTSPPRIWVRSRGNRSWSRNRRNQAWSRTGDLDCRCSIRWARTVRYRRRDRRSRHRRRARWPPLHPPICETTPDSFTGQYPQVRSGASARSRVSRK
jgi:hypothetical protein